MHLVYVSVKITDRPAYFHKKLFTVFFHQMIYRIVYMQYFYSRLLHNVSSYPKWNDSSKQTFRKASLHIIKFMLIKRL